MTEDTRKHVWISNRTFARITGIRRVCMVCGQPSDTAPRDCPGRRLESLEAPR